MLQPTTTATIATDFRSRLRNDEIVIGCNVRHSRTSEIGAILRHCGYHWMMTDFEHSPMSTERAYDLQLGAIRAGVLPIARPQRNDPAEIASHLSNGALGVMVPHVNNLEEAQRAARSSRYPPQGVLSVPGSIPQLTYEPGHLARLAQRFNDEVFVVAMIESEEAVGNVDAIAGVSGIDCLYIGASDLSFDLGIPSEYGHPRVIDAVRSTCDAARHHGKVAGIGGPRDPADWRRYTQLGMRFLLTENDLSMLISKMTERASFYTGLPRTS